MKKLSIILAFAGLLLLCNSGFGQTAPEHIVGSRTVNGIFIKDIETNRLKGISVELFTDYVTGGTTTAVYNESGSVSVGNGTITPGMINTSDILDNSSLKVIANNFTGGAATLSVYLHQFIGTTSNYGSQTYKYGTGTYIIKIEEYSEYISIGITPTTGSVTTSVFYDGVTRKIP